MRHRGLLFIGCLLLNGCAGIHVQALSPDGLTASGQPGLRYYMPKPYLLVTELPVAVNGQVAPVRDKVPVDVPPPGAAQSPKDNARNPSLDQQLAGAAKTATPDKASANDDGAAGAVATSPASATDAGYQHQLNEYQVKLIYLPDMSRPMAITSFSGLGSVSMQPSLVDGWMLTSLQGSADSKVAETLTALASVITARKGPAATASGAGKAGGGPPEDRILVPGLYSFEYEQRTGILTQLCYVTLFGNVKSASIPNDVDIKRCSRDVVKSVPMGPWTASTQ